MKITTVVMAMAILALAGCATQNQTAKWTPSDQCLFYALDPSIPSDTRETLMSEVRGCVEQMCLRQYAGDEKIIEDLSAEIGSPTYDIAKQRLKGELSASAQNAKVTPDILAVVLDDTLPYAMRVSFMKDLAPFFTQEQLLLFAHLKHHDELRAIAIAYLIDEVYLKSVSENANDALACAASKRIVGLQSER